MGEEMDKVTSACGICCLGWLCFPITLFILGSSEKHYVCTNNNILLADKNAAHTDCTSSPGDNKFIHLSCNLDKKAFTNFTSNDFIPGFGTKIAFSSVSGSMNEVQMYSCVETITQIPDPSCSSRRRRKDSSSCPTIPQYSYKMDWRRANTANFDQTAAGLKARGVGCPLTISKRMPRNPALPTNLVNVGKETKGPPAEVKLEGSFFITKATHSAKFTPDATVPLKAFAGKFKTPGQLPKAQTGTGTFTDKTVAVVDNYLQTCDAPFLGCVRLSFTQNSRMSASIIANSGSMFRTAEEKMAATWLPPCPEDAWTAFEFGIVNKDKMLDNLTSSNENTLYFKRIFGILGCWAAVFCCLYPIVAFFDIMEDYMAMIPCIGPCLSTIGQVVETLVTMVVCCMSCSFGCSAALFTIAIVWLVMRPLQGMLMLAACICMVGGAHGLLQLVPKKGGGEARDLNTELQSAA